MLQKHHFLHIFKQKTEYSPALELNSINLPIDVYKRAYRIYAKPNPLEQPASETASINWSLTNAKNLYEEDCNNLWSACGLFKRKTNQKTKVNEFFEMQWLDESNETLSDTERDTFLENIAKLTVAYETGGCCTMGKTPIRTLIAELHEIANEHISGELEPFLDAHRSAKATEATPLVRQ